MCIYEYSSADDEEPTDQEIWDNEAVYPIKITFDLTKKDYDCFNLTDHNGAFRIKNEDEFYMRFDGSHRMWYTMQDPDDVRLFLISIYYKIFRWGPFLHLKMSKIVQKGSMQKTTFGANKVTHGIQMKF